jgi:hypothetical protein
MTIHLMGSLGPWCCDAPIPLNANLYAIPLNAVGARHRATCLDCRAIELIERWEAE